MKKKVMILILFIVGLAVLVVMLYWNGIITFDTYSANNKTISETSTVDELQNGCYYVWHNDKSDDITGDLEGVADANVFKLCPMGDVNWDDDTFVTHTLWFTSSNDPQIPTLYPGDKLLYISANKIPFEGINWERFSDYGYTIGVANLVGDSSGHYRIKSSDGEDFCGYVYSGSDANELTRYASVSNLFLDKVGGLAIRDNSISAGGTVLNLDKDHEYICEWYTGTYYQDFKMKANIHTFSSLETFTTYDYEFLHSNVIEISIPEWFKTGYYYVDGVGLFRYVTETYVASYNGKPFDANVYWNDPIILYDDYGNVIYNPATGVDKINAVDGNGNASEGENENGNGSGNGNSKQNTNKTSTVGDGNGEMYHADDGDIGVEFYESNTDVEDPNYKF